MITGYLLQALTNSVFSTPDKIAKSFVIFVQICGDFFLKVLFIFTEQMQLTSNI
jgi:hypothetical protein